MSPLLRLSTPPLSIFFSTSHLFFYFAPFDTVEPPAMEIPLSLMGEASFLQKQALPYLAFRFRYFIGVLGE